MHPPRSLTHCIDYLQRSVTDLRTFPPTGGSVTEAAASRSVLIRGVQRLIKTAGPEVAADEWNPPTRALLTGLYGYRIAPLFIASGHAGQLDLQLGVWTASPKDARQLTDRRIGVVRSLLAAAYPHVHLAEGLGAADPAPLGGIALGVPSVGPTGFGDPAAPWDRLARAMLGSTWSVMVLAAPVDERAVGAQRDAVLNEIRAVESDRVSQRAPSPLADYYVGLLAAQLAALQSALAVGAWRTTVYLLGDADSYPRLASVWRGVFAGPESVPEPVRVFDWSAVPSLAARTAIVQHEGSPGPSAYRRPLEMETILTSSQLAIYLHLPESETPGFAVDRVAHFDSVPQAASDGTAVHLGRVVRPGRVLATPYAVEPDKLTQHVFVAGLTGSGKTNTVVSLLDQIDAAGVPFLVIEPAKMEYRSLLAHPRIGPRLRVFTVGDELVSPFRLNPFEVPEGSRVVEHLDLLRAVFAASFGMWTPLPQVLERCLHEIYSDRGWDLRSGHNTRLSTNADRHHSFPTLTDLVDKVGEIVPALGYEEKITADIQAALTTRLDSLRRGAKGAMLDVVAGFPIEEILDHPTVLELEWMGDESDRAFMMGLLLIRLAEKRRSSGQARGLVHIVVFEEAHRLLANVPTRLSEESANARGQAVESFANLLSEIRGYGEGVIIADQIPTRLIPDVVKNTNLKIAHRLVAADDQELLGATMAMGDEQARALATLRTGQAAVFSEGDDAPVLIQVPLLKDALSTPGDGVVAKWMRQVRGDSPLTYPYPICAMTCAGSPDACQVARRMLGEEALRRAVARTVLSTVEDPSAFDRMWDDLLSVVRARRPPRLDEPTLLRALAGHAAHWFAHRRGSQAGWTYAVTNELVDVLCRVLLDKIGYRPDPQARVHLRDHAYLLHARTFLPYSHCQQICAQQPPRCMYRWAVADLVASGRFQPAWREADANDANDRERRRRQTWQICQDAGYELIEFPESDWADEDRSRVSAAARRVCLCFEQQMLADDARKLPRTSRIIIAQVIEEANGT